MFYQTELETQVSENAQQYWISLSPKDPVDLSNRQSYLHPTETSANGLPVEQALDVVLGHHRKLSDDIAIVHKRKAFSINGSLTDAGDRFRFQNSVLTALRGYFSSVRMSESSVLVNINVSHGAFYTPSPLVEIIRWLGNLPSVSRSKVPGLLRGLRVKSTHIPRYWSIWGFPRDGDGKGYMLHPPRFKLPDAESYTPDQVRFFHEEKPKGSSTDPAQALSEEDKRKAKEGKLRPHDEVCSCRGSWLSVAEYFQRGVLTPQRLLRCSLISFNSTTGANSTQRYEIASCQCWVQQTPNIPTFPSLRSGSGTDLEAKTRFTGDQGNDPICCTQSGSECKFDHDQGFRYPWSDRSQSRTGDSSPCCFARPLSANVHSGASELKFMTTWSDSGAGSCSSRGSFTGINLLTSVGHTGICRKSRSTRRWS